MCIVVQNISFSLFNHNFVFVNQQQKSYFFTELRLFAQKFLYFYFSFSLASTFSGYDSSTFYTLHSNFSSFWGHNVETHGLSQYIYFFIEIYSPALSTAPFKKIIYFSVVWEDKKASLKTNLFLRMILRGLRRLLSAFFDGTRGMVFACLIEWFEGDRMVWQIGMECGSDLNGLRLRQLLSQDKQFI